MIEKISIKSMSKTWEVHFPAKSLNIFCLLLLLLKQPEFHHLSFSQVSAVTDNRLLKKKKNGYQTNFSSFTESVHISPLYIHQSAQPSVPMAAKICMFAEMLKYHTWRAYTLTNTHTRIHIWQIFVMYHTLIRENLPPYRVLGWGWGWGWGTLGRRK